MIIDIDMAVIYILCLNFLWNRQLCMQNLIKRIKGDNKIYLMLFNNSKVLFHPLFIVIIGKACFCAFC